MEYAVHFLACFIFALKRLGPVSPKRFACLDKVHNHRQRGRQFQTRLLEVFVVFFSRHLSALSLRDLARLSNEMGKKIQAVMEPVISSYF